MYEKIEKYTVNTIPDKGYEVIGHWKDDIHDIRSRLVFDYYTYKILEAEVEGLSAPFEICHQGFASIKNILGEQVGPGFNKIVKQKVMGKEGCIHVGELVLNSVQAAIQAASRKVPDWADDQDYASRWAAWEMMYKNKCIYFAQPDSTNNSPEKIHAVITKTK